MDAQTGDYGISWIVPGSKLNYEWMIRNSYLLQQCSSYNKDRIEVEFLGCLHTAQLQGYSTIFRSWLSFLLLYATTTVRLVEHTCVQSLQVLILSILFQNTGVQLLTIQGISMSTYHWQTHSLVLVLVEAFPAVKKGYDLET
jgi:hypothetical protein